MSLHFDYSFLEDFPTLPLHFQGKKVEEKNTYTDSHTHVVGYPSELCVRQQLCIMRYVLYEL